MEAHEYAEYRVACRRALFGQLPGRVWGKWTRLVGYRTFTIEELRKRFGRDWDQECRLALLNDRFEIDGRPPNGTWIPLSQWRLDEKRQAQDLAELLMGYQRRFRTDSGEEEPREAAARLSLRMSAVKGRKPGLGEVFYHLEEHESVPPGFASDVARLLIQKGWDHLGDESTLENWDSAIETARKNGRQRAEVERKPCRFEEQATINLKESDLPLT
jgi:hypothetical protein